MAQDITSQSDILDDALFCIVSELDISAISAPIRSSDYKDLPLYDGPSEAIKTIDPIALYKKIYDDKKTLIDYIILNSENITILTVILLSHLEAANASKGTQQEAHYLTILNIYETLCHNEMEKAADTALMHAVCCMLGFSDNLELIKKIINTLPDFAKHLHANKDNSSITTEIQNKLTEILSPDEGDSEEYSEESSSYENTPIHKVDAIFYQPPTSDDELERLINLIGMNLFPIQDRETSTAITLEQAEDNAALKKSKYAIPISIIKSPFDGEIIVFNEKTGDKGGFSYGRRGLLLTRNQATSKYEIKRSVFIKVQRKKSRESTRRFKKRLQKEETLTRITRSGPVFLTFSNDDNKAYITMKLLEDTLRNIVANIYQNEALSYKIKVLKISQLAINFLYAIQEIHIAEIIHGDLKSENIMLDKDGRLKVIDFGLAEFSTSEYLLLSASGTLPYIDPISYLAPKLDFTLDHYATAVTINYLLFGDTYINTNRKKQRTAHNKACRSIVKFCAKSRDDLLEKFSEKKDITDIISEQFDAMIDHLKTKKNKPSKLYHALYIINRLMKYTACKVVSTAQKAITDDDCEFIKNIFQTLYTNIKTTRDNLAETYKKLRAESLDCSQYFAFEKGGAVVALQSKIGKITQTIANHPNEPLDKRIIKDLEDLIATYTDPTPPRADSAPKSTASELGIFAEQAIDASKQKPTNRID
ncbi:MAG: protein kinase [Gammaproteobacteria bacterium]|nr:protein kinase [Gammaproteobacteria bacterium]